MGKILHSLPWTLALAMAQAGNGGEAPPALWGDVAMAFESGSAPANEWPLPGFPAPAEAEESAPEAEG